MINLQHKENPANLHMCCVFCINPALQQCSFCSENCFCFNFMDQGDLFQRFLNLLHTGGDLLKVGRTAHIIEIAQSICTLRLCPTFEKLFTGIKVQRKGAECKKS